MPPKRGRKKKNVEAEAELSAEEHFSDDEVYDPPDEEEIVFEEAIARPQKLRLSDVNTSNLRLNKVDVRRYVQACNYSWVDFMKRNGVSDALKKLVDERRFEYEVVSDVFAALPDLANSESLDLYQTQIKPSQLSHLNSATKMANHMERQAKEDPPTHQDALRLKFLECREIRYPTDTKKPDAYFGSGLDAYCKELWQNKDATAYNDKEFQTPSSALMVNIGNPIAAIAICPNADELGNELLALSAFPDEEWLTPDEEVNSYVQFYSYNPNDFNSAKCRFLLEIPSQIVLDLKFCPNFVNVPGNPKAIDDSSDFLGLLAVSTSKGLVLIYRISKNLPQKIDGKVPIVSLKPSITLVHPEIQVKTSNSDGGTQEIGTSSRIPIFSLDWPPVDGGNLILAASEARRVMIWDLSETPEPREMTEEAYLQLSDTLLLPKLTLFEASWQSPPNTVCFLNENELVIAFRNRTILVYKVPECEVCLTESTPKSAGVVVTAAPATFRSFLSADATLANVDGILYAQTCYISLKEAGYEVALIPALNRWAKIWIAVGI
uniref:WD_REPEATS_REGION domain-containing protein n=1 Tax=Bursaphelenchus xylophilus TaxID=6326 RepID=A0A1I7SFY5_BURXY